MELERANALKVPWPLPWPAAAAILLNLIPVFGVLFLGWSAFALIFLYWLENVIIGVRTLVSILANGVMGGAQGMAAPFFAVFFTFHYGLFCFVHGTFVVALFGQSAMGEPSGGVVEATRALLTNQTGILLGFASIAVWQVVQFILFLVRGEVRETNPLTLMASPYPRIIVLHVTIIFGGFLLMLLNQPVAGLVMLALVKMAFDVAEALGRIPRFMAGSFSNSDHPPQPPANQP